MERRILFYTAMLKLIKVITLIHWMNLTLLLIVISENNNIYVQCVCYKNGIWKEYKAGKSGAAPILIPIISEVAGYNHRMNIALSRMLYVCCN